MTYNYEQPAPQKAQDKSNKSKIVKIICISLAAVCVCVAVFLAINIFSNNVMVDGKLVNKKLTMNCNGVTFYLGQEVEPDELAEDMELPVLDTDSGRVRVGIENKFIIYLQQSGRDYCISGWEIWDEDISYAGIFTGDDIEDAAAVFPVGQAYGVDGSTTASFRVFFDMNGKEITTGEMWKLWKDAGRSKKAQQALGCEYPALWIDWNPYTGEIQRMKLTVEIDD